MQRPGTYTVTLVVSNAAGDSPPFTTTITLGTTPCTAPTATFTISPAGIPDNTNPTNWFYYRNNGHDGTAFNFDGTTSSFMSDPACHPHWDWDFAGLTTPHPTTPVGHVLPFRPLGKPERDADLQRDLEGHE